MSVGTAPRRPVRLDGIADLTDGSRLAPLLGPVAGIELDPLVTTGYSGARHRRMRVQRLGAADARLVLKLTSATSDWVHRMTGARCSREAELVGREELAGVWSIFVCPYVAWAEQGPETGLLVHDAGAAQLPDAREPITREQEDLLLHALARLHAQFWARTLPATEWMATLDTYRSLMGPGLPGHVYESLLPEGLRPAVVGGWGEAFRSMPEKVAEHLRAPAPERVRGWSELPHTVVHGDARVTNFAILKDGRVAAYDWSLIGWAPAPADVGWFIAVNAGRLTRSKDDVLAAYRRLLEMQLSVSLAPDEWKLFQEVAVEMGARMLLWAKANALVRGGAAARAEWEWWIERLAAHV